MITGLQTSQKMAKKQMSSDQLDVGRHQRHRRTDEIQDEMQDGLATRREINDFETAKTARTGNYARV